MPYIELSFRGGDSLRRLADRFDRAAAVLQGRLTDAVRDEAPAAVVAVRSAWLGVEVASTGDGGEHSGLRGRVAAATDAEPIPDGVRIRVHSPVVDAVYGQALVHGLNGSGTWHHPVFGRRGTVTVQYGQNVFAPTLQARRAAWEQALERVVDQVAREIER